MKPRPATNGFGLAQGERWQQPLHCPGCRETTYLHVVGEGPKRMHLQCPDCGSGRYIHAPGERRLGGGWGRRIDLPADRICAEYLAGDSIAVLEHRYHVSHNPIRNILEQHGIPRRNAATEATRYALQYGPLGKAACLAKGRRTTARVLELDATGISTQAVARQLGMSTHGVQVARARATRYTGAGA